MSFERPLTRLTVNLTGPAVVALTEAAAASGDTCTDTVNRALIVYREVVRAGLPARVDVDDIRIRMRVRPRGWWRWRKGEAVSRG
jgi:hypothetical protein